MEQREFFDRSAVGWDSRIGPALLERLRTLLARFPIAPGASVLDAGCGTGVLVPLLLERVGKAGRVVAVDFSPGMLDVARAKAFPANVEFVLADVAAMPLPEADLDAVVCNATFPHLPDRPRALAEFSRVLRPGGWLAICHASGREEIARRHRAVGVPIAYDELPDEAEMRRLLAAAGFDDIEVADDEDRYLATARWSGPRIR